MVHCVGVLLGPSRNVVLISWLLRWGVQASCVLTEPIIRRNFSYGSNELFSSLCMSVSAIHDPGYIFLKYERVAGRDAALPRYQEFLTFTDLLTYLVMHSNPWFNLVVGSPSVCS